MIIGDDFFYSCWTWQEAGIKADKKASIMRVFCEDILYRCVSIAFHEGIMLIGARDVDRTRGKEKKGTRIRDVG